MAACPYFDPAGHRHGVGQRAAEAIDLVRIVRERGGITASETAVALFGFDSNNGRHAARVVLRKLCETGELRRERAHPQGFGSKPDLFMAAT